jgi:hypothetical protein
MLVLNSSRKETIDASLRASSEMARFAATSGLNYAISWLADANNDDEVLNILLSWREHQIDNDEEPARWLTGNANAYEQLDGMRVRVQIVNVDFSQVNRITRRVVNDNGIFRFQFNPTDILTQAQRAQMMGEEPNLFLPIAPSENSRITILLRSEAIDRSGSRASNLGFFKVYGFEFEEENMPNFPEFAMFLRGGFMRIHSQMIVSGGPVFLDNTEGNERSIDLAWILADNAGLTNRGVRGRSEFRNGFYLVQTNGMVGALAAQLADVEFGGGAYFEGGEVMFFNSQDPIRAAANATINFNRGFGGNSRFNFWERGIQVANNMSAMFSAGVTFNNNLIGGAPPINFGVGGFLRGANLPENLAAGGFAANNTAATRDEILTTLGLNQETPVPFIIFPQALTALARDMNNSERITGAQMNDWLADANANNIFTDGRGERWLVLRLLAGSGFAVNDNTIFTGRAVVIAESPDILSLPRIRANANVEENGVVLFYIPNGQNATNIMINNNQLGMEGSGIGGTFRGMIYNAANNIEINITSDGTWRLLGALYNVGTPPNAPTRVINFQGGRRTEIEYDINVMCELANLGIFGAGIICNPNGGGGGNATTPIQRIPFALYPRVRTELLNRSY